MAKLFRNQKHVLAGLIVLLLMAAPNFAPTAQADSGDYAQITVNATGAIAGSLVEVQYQDVSGQWVTVDGWKGTLDGITGLIGPYKIWTVYKANFGQGPFRWVVFNHDGQSVWGISDPFNLPSHGIMNLTLNVIPGVTGTPATAPTAAAPSAAPGATPAAASTPAPLSASSSLLLTDAGHLTFILSCSGGCNSSAISGYFRGLPASSWIVVQYGDGLGNWDTVQGWQGPADSVDATTGQLTKNWSVAYANYDQGPFRWAVFDAPGGTLLGYSASFRLPARAGLHEIMILSR